MVRRMAFAAVLVTALFMLGCDVMDQNVTVYEPGRPPGQDSSDEESSGATGSEDQAQTHIGE